MAEKASQDEEFTKLIVELNNRRVAKIFDAMIGQLQREIQGTSSEDAVRWMQLNFTLKYLEMAKEVALRDDSRD